MIQKKNKLPEKDKFWYEISKYDLIKKYSNE